MIEKVNPMHPDKIADRIAGAMVDLAYTKSDRPKIAVEVLIGHDECHIIAETSEHLELTEINDIVERISGLDTVSVDYHEVPQDVELAKNQSEQIKCGDNGIFKGMPLTNEQIEMSAIAHHIYAVYGTDGKYILNDKTDQVIVCQSHANSAELKTHIENVFGHKATINPLGEWTGGVNVDTGATNRKLGSDMADAVTGGGLHGKDLSKADVAVNIYAHLKAQETKKPVEIFCAIGDSTVDGKPYGEIVEIARNYINDLGGFEKLAEWGLF